MVCCVYISLVLHNMMLFLLIRGHQYKVNLDPDGQYIFEWSVDYTRDTVDIELTTQTSTDFWFAVGFSDYGELTNADLFVVGPAGYLGRLAQDSHTDDHGILMRDRQQDYHVTKMTSEDDRVVVEFQRKFDTCDRFDYILDNGTTHIVYVDPVSTSHKHPPFGSTVTQFRHGLQRVQLLKPELPEQKFPKDTWTFDILAPNVTVPDKETTYWWYTTLLPQIPVKLHIIKYEGVIAKGNEDLVHHMEVFHCELTQGGRIPFYNGPGLSEGKPKGLGVCRRVIGAWAMGAQAMIYPDEAGVPVGGADMSRCVVLEIHYNNPHLTSGRTDNSGIRFYVTPVLRRHEAAIMELGLEYTNKMAVPPGQAEFSLSGYCVQDCTRLGLPPKGIHVFASQLHTHLTGKRVVTRHFRRGTELPDLNRDDHYSPHFQEIRRLSTPVQVLPRDALITTCDYNTLDRDKATVGGFSISDEMCVNYIHYYPRTDLEVCKSSVETQALNAFFFFLQRLKYLQLSPSLGYRTNYQMVPWTASDTELLKTLYQTSPLAMQCNHSDGTRFPGDWEHVPIPEVLYPLDNVHVSCMDVID